MVISSSGERVSGNPCRRTVSLSRAKFSEGPPGSIFSDRSTKWKQTDEDLAAVLASLENHVSSVGEDLQGLTEEPEEVAFPHPPAPLVRVSNDDLQEAALRGDVELVSRLVSAGASPNAPMRDGATNDFVTLLHVLASKPSSCAAEICRLRANLNARSSVGLTPLMCACLGRHLGMVQVLVDYRAELTPVDDFGRTALSCAIGGTIEEEEEQLQNAAEQSQSGDEDSDEHVGEDDECKGVTEAPCNQQLIELLRLLADAGQDMDDGGDVTPLVEAVRKFDTPMVKALLGFGATPRGLHDGVALGPLCIIQALVEAEANPFELDSQGKNAMDLALTRGDAEITTLLRDFVGDLERQRHPHLLTRDAPPKTCFADKPPACAAPTHHRQARAQENLVVSNCGSTRVICRRVNQSPTFQLLMFLAMFASLFLPDMWTILDMESNFWLDYILLAIYYLFCLDVAVQVIGFWLDYAFTGWFWLDFIGAFSVLADHSYSSDALDFVGVSRAAWIAKFGARAGRFAKLVRVLRYLPGIGRQEAATGTTKTIVKGMSASLGIRIAGLMLLLVMVLPGFDRLSQPWADHSMSSWMQILEVASSYGNVSSEVADFESFYEVATYYPYELRYETTEAVTMQLGTEPSRSQNRVQFVSDSGRTWAYFDFREPNRTEAFCNLGLLVTVLMLLIVMTFLLSSTLRQVVVSHFEAFFEELVAMTHRIAAMVGSLDIDQGAADDLDVDTSDAAFGFEVQQLERVLHKIQAMNRVLESKSPLDAAALEELTETDRAILEAYGTALPKGDCGFDSSEPADQRRTAEDHLWEVSLEWAALDSWEVDSIDLNDAQRRVVCLCAFLLNSASELPTYYTFIDAVAESYKGPEEVPYHNFAHAVDVVTTTFRLLNLCNASRFLSPLERFALLVASLGHDVGHPGVNNPFLVETGHDLALRYNDVSPLENMHCATLFSIASRPGMDIFAGLDEAQVRALRSICVEAILQTDYTHHFASVKEVQVIFEVNSDLFENSNDNWKLTKDFPKHDVVEVFHRNDVRRTMRNLFVYMSDLGNQSKPFAISRRWSELVLEEFFRQGDIERKLGVVVQPLNDRGRVNKCYSQLCFIEFFVSPLVLAAVQLLPPLTPCAERMLANLRLWFQEWVTSEPPLDEQVKVNDRVTRMEQKFSKAQSAKIVLEAPVPSVSSRSLASGTMARNSSGNFSALCRSSSRLISEGSVVAGARNSSPHSRIIEVGESSSSR